MWHKPIIDRLRTSELFQDVALTGAKIRATVDESRFLDIHFDPTTRSYSYALIDLRIASPGDKRLLGWDDYPHEGVAAIEQLESYPNHFQRRTRDGGWIFEASPFTGEIEGEIDALISIVTHYLQSR